MNKGMQPLAFSKMHGLGNDFIVINCLDKPFQWSTTDIVRLADRHSGIGFDQLLIIESAPTPECDFAYRIFNRDGNEVEHCGNGARCFGKFVRDKRLFSDDRPIKVAVKKGVIDIAYVGTDSQVDLFRVDMGEPNFAFLTSNQRSALEQPVSLPDHQINVGIVSMGNPHAVLTVKTFDDDVVANIGKSLQQHPLFPAQVNVGFMQILNDEHIKLRVFERGVGETQACGTGACAAVAIGRAQGKLAERVAVELSRGRLLIEWQGKGFPLYMTGPAEHVFDGILT